MFEIQNNVPLRNLNTFHLDARASAFVEISRVEDFQSLVASGMMQIQPVLFLGGGSNILLTGDFSGLVVHLANKGIDIEQITANKVFVKVAAGENWDDFVHFCVQQGFGGIENLSLIPGNAGSCPIQNIGAYGVEVKDFIHSVEFLEVATGKAGRLTNRECAFGYRDSIFKKELKGKVVIWSVTFALDTHPELRLNYGAIRQELEKSGVSQATLFDIRQAITSIRCSKLPDPELLGNAGSFFKNPTVNNPTAQKLKEQFPGLIAFDSPDGNVKLSAGWLIENCGLKGYRQGDTGVHKDQALVLVNYGMASGNDILNLAKHIQSTVYQRFKIDLDIEVNII